jgi:response regulator RpfG family c-di-GMP phosphodiesterase
VADDEESVRRFISRVLVHGGYELESAANGRAALARLREQRFDLLITDLRMPEMDGLTLLEECKAAYPDTDVLMLTGYGTIESAVHAMKLGALDFMTKPFGISELEAKVQACLDLRRKRRASQEPPLVQTLMQINQALTAAPDPEHALEALVRLVERALEPGLVRLTILDSSLGLEGLERCADARLAEACPAIRVEQILDIARRPDAWLFQDYGEKGDDTDWSGHVLSVPLMSGADVVGGLTLARAADATPFVRHDAELLLVFGFQIALSLMAAHAQHQVLALFGDLGRATLSSVEALSEALGVFDPYTREHSRRVAAYARLLGERLGLDQARLEQLAIGALLHDVGKLGVGDETLHKSEALTSAEFDRVKLHPVLGAKILSAIPAFAEAALVVHYHHERYDGMGYPDGLVGEAIPLMARMVTVVDSFDSMTSDRPYRPAVSDAEALQGLAASAGAHLDDALLHVWTDLVRQGAHLAHRRLEGDGG